MNLYTKFIQKYHKNCDKININMYNACQVDIAITGLQFDKFWIRIGLFLLHIRFDFTPYQTDIILSVSIDTETSIPNWNYAKDDYSYIFLIPISDRY